MFGWAIPHRSSWNVLRNAAMLLSMAANPLLAGSAPPARPMGQSGTAPHVLNTHLFLPVIGQKITAPDLRRLTDAPGTETQPALSPDQRQVVYVGVDADGSTDLYLVDLAGGTPTHLTHSPSVVEETPVFAPDGTRIVFGRNAGQGWDIYAIAPDGSGLQPMVAAAGSDESHPAFSPDGQTLYFDSNRARESWDIYQITLPDGPWSGVVTGPDTDRFPVVGFGGTHLIFRSESDGNSDIYRLDTDLSQLRRLTTDPLFDGYPAATPAHPGMAFAVVDDAGAQIWQMNDAGGAIGPIPPTASWQVETPRLSYDGKWLVYAATLPGESTDIFLSPYISPLQQMGSVSFDGIDCGWEGGVLALGWAKAWESTGDRLYWDWVKGWVDACDRADKQVEHVNDLLYGYAALIVHTLDPQQKYLDIAQTAADFVMQQAPRASDGTLLHLGDAAWPDTLIMAVPFLLEMGAKSNSAQYTQEAITQTNLHSVHLQDAASGLYRHAWPASATGISGPAYWGRGNGWMMAVAAEILRVTPEGTPGRDTVLTHFRRQADALLPLQAVGGLWPTVVDQPDFYREASGSALIGAALLEGSARGWLDAARFGPAAQRAREGILGNMESSGKLGGVSGPTGPMQDVAAYHDIATDVWVRYGQGAALLIGAADLEIRCREWCGRSSSP